MRISRINGKRTITGGLVLAAAFAAAVPASAAQAGTRVTSVQAAPRAGIFGCPRGAVCMYYTVPTFFSTPEHSWTAYRCYNLVGERGPRWIFNNQTGGATATLSKSYCPQSGPSKTIQAGRIDAGDITPYNSISLNP